MTNINDELRTDVKWLVQIIVESSVKTFRTPLEITITELELTDISEKILKEINSRLVNFKLFHHMVSADNVN